MIKSDQLCQRNVAFFLSGWLQARMSRMFPFACLAGWLAGGPYVENVSPFACLAGWRPVCRKCFLVLVWVGAAVMAALFP